MGRILRFGLTGLAATAGHVGITLGCRALWPMPLELATTIGMASAMWISYFGHQGYTFQVERDHKAQLPRFIVATVFLHLLNIAIVAVTGRVFALPDIAGLAAVTMIIPVANYLISRFWTFRPGMAGLTSLSGQS
jgi:putative flippase GtrA